MDQHDHSAERGAVTRSPVEGSWRRLSAARLRPIAQILNVNKHLDSVIVGHWPGCGLVTITSSHAEGRHGSTHMPPTATHFEDVVEYGTPRTGAAPTASIEGDSVVDNLRASRAPVPLSGGQFGSGATGTGDFDRALREALEREEALRTVLRALIASLRPLGFNRKRFQRCLREEGQDIPADNTVRHLALYHEARRVLREAP